MCSGVVQLLVLTRRDVARTHRRSKVGAASNAPAFIALSIRVILRIGVEASGHLASSNPTSSLTGTDSISSMATRHLGQFKPV